MKSCLYAFALLVFLCQLAHASPSKKLFDATLEDVPGGGRVLSVGFYTKLPPPEIVDKIVRESLNNAILIDSSNDILAMGFLGNDTLNDNQYSGSLIYKAKQKQIVTFDEARGVKTTIKTADGYFVAISEEKTAEGITPENKWLSVTIVFPNQPTREAAYNAIHRETEKLSSKGININLYVSTGDKNKKTSWHQVKDNDGAYIFAEYDQATKQLMRQGKLLK